MLIYRKQLEDLLEYKNKTDDLMISLYLNVSPTEDISSHLNALIHKTRKEIKEDLDKEKFREVDSLLSTIENYARTEFIRLKNTRLVVLFADTTGFWQEYRLPVPFRGKLIVSEHPYIRPVSMLLDEFERYLVLVADSRHARIFSLYLGDFQEEPDVFFQSEVPDRVNVNKSMAAGSGGESTMGVFSGVGDKQIEGHIQEHILKHLKDASEKTFDLFKKRKFTRLIIGSPDDKSRPSLINLLHSYLQERLAGEFTAQPTLKDSELKRMAMEAAEKHEREKERQLIDTMLEKSHPGNLAVLGFDSVIKALEKGQVHILAIEKDYRKKGYICYNDHILSIDRKNCPICSKPMDEVNDLIDEMVEIALLHDAEVRHIFLDHEEFQKYHAGAILRFAL